MRVHFKALLKLMQLQRSHSRTKNALCMLGHRNDVTYVPTRVRNPPAQRLHLGVVRFQTQLTCTLRAIY